MAYHHVLIVHISLFTVLVVMVAGKQTGISKEDRQPIFNLVRRLVYIRSEASLHAWYTAILELTYATSNPYLVKHIQQLWRWRSEWAQ